jgi:hypothetical protein
MAMAAMQYLTYLEPVTLESLRLDHSPRDGMGIIHICFYAVLRSDSGHYYNVMRGLPHPDKKSSMNFGTYRGTDDLDAPGCLAISFRDQPAVEPFWTTYGDESVIYAGETFRYEMDTEGYTWQEAGGRVDLRVRRLGQAFSLYVPRQRLFDYPIIMRDHLGKVEGTIDGEAVAGVFHDTHMYSQPDKTFNEIAFVTRLENYWMDWLVEYDDGTLEGGFAMRGHPITDYTVAHHYVDGRSHARSDATLEIDRNSAGTMHHVRLAYGANFELHADQLGSFDWPLHTYGTVTSIANRDKRIVNSWNYTENWPLNWEQVQNYQLAYAELFGRYPSLRSILDKSTIANERLVLN